MTIRSIAISASLVLTLVACGRTATPGREIRTSTPSPEPSAGTSPLSPPPTSTPALPEHTSPLPDPAISPVEPPPGAVDEVVAAAKAHLAQARDVASNDIEVTAVEPVEWSDASLGCPKPGQAYAQVVTPGYRIVLEVDGRAYELHTDRSGRSVVICERQLDRGPAAGVAYLAEELGIPAEEIEVISVERVEWPDASLGCPEPGKSYAQVITPGYRIHLEAQGEQYEVHTDAQGRFAVACESDQ